MVEGEVEADGMKNSKTKAIAGFNKEFENTRWSKLYTKGQETAKKFKVKSETDIDKILHDSSIKSGF